MSTNKLFEKTQKEELKSWLSDDPKINRDKRLREIIRYPLLKKQMGLDYLDTSGMLVADIGCGLYGGVSTVIKAKEIHRFDPLMNEYLKHYPIHNAHMRKAEDINLMEFDLIIVTNALDHFESPTIFLRKLAIEVKPGAYVGMLHAINNAYTHPHEAHAFNISPEIIHEHMDRNFEFVWELCYPDLRYGWVKYEGKVGQPAHSFLARKTTGY